MSNRNIVRTRGLIPAWLATQSRRCWACGRGEFYGHRLEVAHIIGGAGRSNEFCNLSLLGSSCHGANHGQRVISDGKLPAFVRLTLANMLWLKLYHDPDNYMPWRLSELKRENMPTPEAPEGWHRINPSSQRRKPL